MICLIIQSRLDSTRLPKKAMLPFPKQALVSFVMERAKQIKADRYVLACDYDSQEVFAPLAKSAGYHCVAGPKEDVLERFCIAIRKTGASIVIRITGDNPFIFTDVANKQIEVFKNLKKKKKLDYFTYLGLPHGSGVEIFSGQSLLEAAVFSDSPYEHEHVGPAIYNYPDRYVCVKEKISKQWFYPEIRTTIDTPKDYDRSIQILDYFKKNNLKFPYSSSEIIQAWNFVEKILLFVPSVSPGRGTGHLVRTIKNIEKLQHNWRCLIYISSAHKNTLSILQDFQQFIVYTLPEKAHIVFLDNFRTEQQEVLEYRKIGPVVALDEGGNGRDFCDYVFDIIPGFNKLYSKPNIFNPNFLELPKYRKLKKPSTIKTVLVLAGGENAAGIADSYAQSLAKMDFEVTLIDPKQKTIIRSNDGYTITKYIPNLKEKLCHYDLVVTHFGFTAFEALAASVSVILFSPTWYHFLLGKRYGFSTISPGAHPTYVLSKIFRVGIKQPSIINAKSTQENLHEKLATIANRRIRFCPLCTLSSTKNIVHRSEKSTFVRCPRCSLVYQIFQLDAQKEYSTSYFFEEYKEQYGKTYLEDFEIIKQLGQRRFSRILKILDAYYPCISEQEKRILDIGCAYGPFLVVAKEKGWQTVGTDISAEAVEFVNNKLNIPAFVSAFPALDSKNKIAQYTYSVITMWYVIEHLEDLQGSLEQVKNLLLPGGVFAFSTPSLSGVSALRNKKQFFQNNPSDHIFILNPHTIKKQFKKQGFSIKKLVSTGHHPNRFPFCSQLKKNGFIWKMLIVVSKIFFLGDTFEVYAIKKGRLEDID